MLDPGTLAKYSWSIKILLKMNAFVAGELDQIKEESPKKSKAKLDSINVMKAIFGKENPS